MKMSSVSEMQVTSEIFKDDALSSINTGSKKNILMNYVILKLYCVPS